MIDILYGQYLPGPSDIVDGLTALDEFSKGNYKAAAGFFLIPGADVFKPLKSLKGVGGDLLQYYDVTGTGTTQGAVLYNYSYDQLNRLQQQPVR